MISGRRYTYFNPVSGSKKLIRLSKVEIWDRGTSSWQTEVTFNKYDNKGNLVESTDANGIKTSYVWGYKGLYLLAKIENAAFSEIANITGQSATSPVPLTGALTPAQKSNLRAVTKTNVDIYDYTPYIGLISHIDPSGQEILYGYNTKGKLKESKLPGNTIFNEYFYSIDNRNN